MIAKKKKKDFLTETDKVSKIKVIIDYEINLFFKLFNLMPFT